MVAGALRHKVTFQQPVKWHDNFGGVAETWIDAFEEWAEIRPTIGKEYFKSQQNQTETTHKIKVRHNSNTETIVKTYRIVFGGRFFRIESIINLFERNRMLDIMCVEHD